jgi:hypothetical protein
MPNRFKSITNEVYKQWLDMTRDAYKTKCMKRLITKDAGSVHESFPFETNRVIWNFCFHKTNPQNEFFKNESTKRIFWNQYGFANPKPRIRKDSGMFKVLLCTKDSSGFVGFVKTGQIFWKSVYETNPRNKSFENIKDSWSTIQNESGFVS